MEQSGSFGDSSFQQDISHRVECCEDCGSDLPAEYIALLETDRLSQLKQIVDHQEAGLDISYRCVRCRNCVDCKNAEKVEEISTENADAQVDEAKPSNQLIIELDTKRVGTSLPSPMVQLDGPMEEGKVKYTFLSDYAEEDIKYTLEEIFPKKNALLISMVQCRPRSAECLCTVEVKIDSGQEFFWPEMDSIQVQVVQDLKEVSS